MPKHGQQVNNPLTLIGCQSKPEHAELSVWPIAEMMKHSQTENLEEKAAEIKRIPLETSDRILIRTVNGLAEADGLWFAKHENQCSVFDSEGNYLLDIGRQGEGPNEYLKLDHFFLKEGKVYLYEAEKEIVRIFTPEGTFVRDFPTGESYNAVYPLGEDTYLGYMDNVSGNELMKIGFFTEKTLLDTIPYTQQFEHKGIYLYFANEGVVFKDGKDFYFKELFNDTIFRIESAHTFTPRYIADLGALRPDPAARHRMTSLIANIWNEDGEMNPEVVSIALRPGE